MAKPRRTDTPPRQPQPFADAQKSVDRQRSTAQDRAIRREENAALDKKDERVDRVHAIER
jgi:hypothetical protein